MSGQEYVINLSHKHKSDLLVIEEHLQNGQYIEKYKVEAYVNNQWLPIAEGQTIGRKRIQFFDPIKTDRIRLSLIGKEGKMVIDNFAVYLSEK